MKNYVVVATPTTGRTPMDYAASLARLASYLEPEQGGWTFLTEEGAGVGRNRDALVDRFLGMAGTHLLFVDEDMAFSPLGLITLLSRDLPLVFANYRRRFPPAEFTAYGKSGVIVTTGASVGLEEARYGGLGFALIRRDVLVAVERPRFLIEYLNGYSSEDVPFFRLVTNLGFPVYVDQDASKCVAHVGTHLYRY